MKKYPSFTLIASAIFGFFLICISSCKPDNPTHNSVLDLTTGIEKFETPIDYSSGGNWLAKPSNITKEVDVIYFYPTAYSKTNDTETDICDIDNSTMRTQSNV